MRSPGTLWDMGRRMSMDWDRIATILGARPGDEMARCPLCRAEGSVPYVAEHVLTTHTASRPAAAIRREVTPRAHPEP